MSEAMVKFLCHNTCVLIQAMYALGVEPEFDDTWTFASKTLVDEKPREEALDLAITNFVIDELELFKGELELVESATWLRPQELVRRETYCLAGA